VPIITNVNANEKKEIQVQHLMGFQGWLGNQVSMD
jgi:hypothetical protein